ncbi:MAG: sugar phosphate isomerase/epimerase, partial [Desulfobacterales bacterium]
LALESLHIILRRAAELAQCVCLENMFPRLGYMVDPAEFAPLFETYAELKLTLDLGHAFIGAKGPARILDFIQRFPDRLHHIHVSDNRGKQDDHKPLGQGTLPYGEVLRTLAAIGYDETMTLEIFSSDRKHLAESRHKIEALLPTVGGGE